MRSNVTLFAAMGVSALVSGVPLQGQMSAPSGPKPHSGDVQILRVQDPMKAVPSHIYMISGAGGNIAVDTFPEGVLLVDSGDGKMSSAVLTAIRSVAEDPRIHYIIDTSADQEHVGGNIGLGAAGNQFVGGNVAGDISDAGVGAEIIAHQTVQDRMSGVTGAKALPEGMWPTTSYETPILKLSTQFHGDAVELLHEPAAHSDGDTVVWFRLSDVIATGEIFSTTNYPVIDVERGGSINGEIKALNHILDVAFAYFRMEGGTMIIPGHGRICDSTDLAYYRDMVTIIRDRVQYMISKGKTLEEIKAAKLTADYDPDYAVNEIGYTPDMFVEAVYKSLTAATKDK
jgi:glyoxylase-like metal-dependent hydrolase (beta-lactamase superfamily II)